MNVPVLRSATFRASLAALALPVSTILKESRNEKRERGLWRRVGSAVVICSGECPDGDQKTAIGDDGSLEREEKSVDRLQEVGIK